MSESFSNSDKEDSFKGAVKKYRRTPKARPIIETDSDTSDENPSEDDDSTSDSSMHVSNFDTDSDDTNIRDSLDNNNLNTLSAGAEKLQLKKKLFDKSKASTSADQIDTTDDDTNIRDSLDNNNLNTLSAGAEKLQLKKKSLDKSKASTSDQIDTTDDDEVNDGDFTDDEAAGEYKKLAEEINIQHNKERTSNVGSKKGKILEISDSEEEENTPDAIISDSTCKNLSQSISDEEIFNATVDNSTYRDRIQESSDEDEALPNENRIEEYSDEERPSTSTDTRRSSGSAEIIEKSFSIVELSDEEEAAGPPILKQTTMKSFMGNSVLQPKEEPQQQKVAVTHAEYQEQMRRVDSIETELSRAKNALRIIKLENLPDNGKSLVEKERALNKMSQAARNVLANMIIDDKAPVPLKNTIKVAWDQIEAGVDAVGPRTFGKKGVERFNAEKALAVETLDHLHKSLETCPTENDFAEDPKGLKIPLMPHQKRALAWLLWREKQKPSGGLLADDMGLGKTLTMISLVLKAREINPDEEMDKENYRDKYSGGTLVVCPASLINQWSGEVEARTKRGLLGVEVYHGAKRETKARRLAQHDLVVTTYALIQSEFERKGAIFGVRWRRIILDESHQIRNHKSKTSEAVFQLSGKSKWALTGTPVHNKEVDMYAVLKFLKCSPFDELQVWKHWVSNKSAGGEMRLHAVISSLMLRRTKAELQEKGALKGLPNRTWELVSVKLEKDEMDVYQRVLIFSRKLFSQFLHQRAERDQDALDMKYKPLPGSPNQEYFKMRNKLLKLNRVKEVSQHEILVLLLRLRQICCHPFLIKQMLQGEEDLGDVGDDVEPEEMNLLDQLNKLNLNDEDDNPAAGSSDANVGLKEASKGFLNPANSVFRAERPSSKIKTLIKMVKEKISTGDKAIVVSQWTSLLNLIGMQMKAERIIFDSLNGTIPVHKRMAIVDNFNDQRSDTRVLLLSLTAGGVGLNLVGGNHLFLLDLHWNPQLESQAQDRIYRMGQTKPIFVYKFMAVETIEERIKALQDKKLEIANSMLTGSKRVGESKLSLQDLKMIFDFK